MGLDNINNFRYQQIAQSLKQNIQGLSQEVKELSANVDSLQQNLKDLKDAKPALITPREWKAQIQSLENKLASKGLSLSSTMQLLKDGLQLLHVATRLGRFSKNMRPILLDSLAKLSNNLNAQRVFHNSLSARMLKVIANTSRNQHARTAEVLQQAAEHQESKRVQESWEKQSLVEPKNHSTGAQTIEQKASHTLQGSIDRVKKAAENLEEKFGIKLNLQFLERPHTTLKDVLLAEKQVKDAETIYKNSSEYKKQFPKG